MNVGNVQNDENVRNGNVQNEGGEGGDVVEVVVNVEDEAAQNVEEGQNVEEVAGGQNPDLQAAVHPPAPDPGLAGPGPAAPAPGVVWVRPPPEQYVLQAVNELATEVRNLQRDTNTRFALLERGLANTSGPPHQATYHGPGPNAPHLVPVGQVTPALSTERRANDPRRDLQGDYTALTVSRLPHPEKNNWLGH